MHIDDDMTWSVHTHWENTQYFLSQAEKHLGGRDTVGYIGSSIKDMKCNTIILKCLNVTIAHIIPNVSDNVAITSNHLHRCLFNNKDDRFSDPALLYIHHQTMSFIFTVPIERKLLRLSLKFSLTSQSSDKMWLSTFTQALRLNTILFTCNLLDSFHVLLLWTCTPLYSEGYVIACVRLLVGR